MTLLTIITRTYQGRQKHLEQAAEFVFSQSFRPIEWLVVEDGSNEASGLLARIRAPNDVHVKHIAIKKQGRSAAANVGLQRAQGELLCFFDDDDELFPFHAETLVSLLRQHPHASGAYAAAYQTPVNCGAADFSNEEVLFFPTFGSYALIWQPLFPIQAVLFKRSAVEGHRFDLNLDALEDWLFWLSIFLEKRLVWTPKITSRFFVPGDDEAKAHRLKSHEAARHHFEVQRNALTKERDLDNQLMLEQYHSFALNNICYQLSSASDQATTHVRKLHRTVPLTPLISALEDGSSFDARSSKAQHTGTVVFTSITLGYLPKALALAESVKAHHPDWEFHILLNDFMPDTLERHLAPVDRVVTAAELSIDNFHSWSFGLTLVELCCATKPFYFKQLLDTGYEYVFYIDPDIRIFDRLDCLRNELKDHHVLVTPHCDKPALTDAEILYTEQSVLAHGVYNLGFLAARQSDHAKEVIDFWRYRCIRYCHDDHPRGVFNDQKWFNLVPLYYGGVCIIRHEGCNVASWNIAHRPLSKVAGKLYAGKDPLLFFHFSGYDANVPRTMFEIFGQYTDLLAEMIDNII